MYWKPLSTPVHKTMLRALTRGSSRQPSWYMHDGTGGSCCRRLTRKKVRMRVAGSRHWPAGPLPCTWRNSGAMAVATAAAAVAAMVVAVVVVAVVAVVVAVVVVTAAGERRRAFSPTSTDIGWECTVE